MAQRQQGYRIAVKVFVPVDPKNLDDTTAKADLVRRVTGGDLSALTGAQFESADHRYVSRQAPAPAPAPQPEIRENQDLPGEENPPVDDAGREIDPDADAEADEPPAGSPASRARRRAA